MKDYTRIFRFGVIGIAIIIGLGWLVSSIYPDWLWFQNLGFESVFSTMLVSKILIGFAAAMVFFLAVGINFYCARFYVRKTHPAAERRGGISLEGLPISEQTVSRAIGAFLIIVAVMIGSAASTKWDMILRYFHPKAFGISDPIFGQDLAFYVFSLPFFLFLKSWLTGFLVVSGMVALLVYNRGNLIHLEGALIQAPERDVRPAAKLTIDPSVRKHLSVLGIIIIAIVIWGYWLKVYQLMYSTKGPAFGASYTDIHVQIIAYKILMAVLGAFAVVLALNMILQKRGLVISGLAVTIGAMVLAGSIVPSLVQKIVVKPNELEKERPYIARNIENTRRAYSLDRIQEKDFVVNENLTLADIVKNRLTIENIRIWDERPLKETYQQLQSIRLYYDFSGVDVDRYILDGQYRQVTLSAREISVDQLSLQARTWVNRHLVYTHGYGLTLNPVNQVTQEGLPNLLVKDLPPVTLGIEVKRPEIYYGEKTRNYVIVRTKEKEFDYPKGDSNVYATYQGDGGVPINSFLRRLLFAITFRSTDILFTGYLTPQSRIMFFRPIETRVKKIAPFLQFDRDPYLVIADGQLFWMLDAYTTTSMYPYSSRMSEKFGLEINYIRNSVKTIVNAYTGKVDFYVMDEADPIIGSFMEIFPGLFRPIDEMPESLKSHIRYPRDLFDIQAAMYRSYHMQDVQVFYNQEDLWEIPNELYADTQQKMEPYYIIIKPPGEKREGFLLMLPFTPSKKANMIAWLAARSDMPNYGDLLVYKLPKDKLAFGPMQVEARVDQQTDISRELTLWGQKGSRVIRGNLLAIPVEQSFLYVEPVYLQASQESGQQVEPAGQMQRPPRSRMVKPTRSIALPELKRVIVAYGNEVVMKESLSSALDAIFGDMKPFKEPLVEEEVVKKSIQDLASAALDHYRRAQEHLKARDWAGYGQALEKMERLLEELALAVQTSSSER
ncbi:MAG: UPF0182 family protein [Proteobacteria bacterium]|nr:UPF0182 family protein [Pseudomonadota bacterium]NIS71674.1 UPF0182 family protein [Pseudomonadota bacterium]